jgi:hypothetical protein
MSNVKSRAKGTKGTKRASPKTNNKPTTTTTTSVNADRQEQLQQQFARNAEHVRQEAYQPELLVADVDRLIHSAAHHHTHNFTGSPSDDAAFRAWISVYLRPKVERLRVFYEMRAAHRKVVHKGLWAIIEKCADLGGDVDTVHELEQDAWSRVWAEIDAWNSPGYGLNGRKPAKITSRLYALARFFALGWRTTRLRERAKFGDTEIARVGYDPQTGVIFIEPKNYAEFWTPVA